MLEPERTTPLLKPLEVQQKAGELRRLQETISAPPHVRAKVQDMGMIVRRRNNLQRDIEENAPKPYKLEELDGATAREKALLANIVQGMPTQAEMRRAPPGAVDKHMAWERANKKKIIEWKNVRRRLHASGDNPSTDEVDLSNLERYRPATASDSLNLDNAVIPSASIHLPPTIEIKNVMSDADRLAAKLDTYCTMAEQGDERAKAILAAFLDDDVETPPAPPVIAVTKSKPGRKPPTEKQIAAREAFAKRSREAAAERKEKKERAALEESQED